MSPRRFCSLIPTEFGRLSFWIAFSALLLCPRGEALAQYLYFVDPAAAHRRMINDFQQGNPDPTNLAPGAQRAIPVIENLLMSLPGGNVRICQTLQVQYPNGSELSFRTYHGPAIVDWVVNVTRDPQVVVAIVALPLRPGAPGMNLPGGMGPPAVLPPYTPGGQQTLTPPTQLGCPGVLSTAASSQQRIEACRRWPRMCE
jgi:hypothetical protein